MTVPSCVTRTTKQKASSNFTEVKRGNTSSLYGPPWAEMAMYALLTRSFCAFDGFFLHPSRLRSDKLITFVA